MAITIRNKETEALIRKIGRRTGEGPSAVITRLVQRETRTTDDTSAASPDLIKKRMRELEDSRLRHTYPDDPKLTWSELEREMNSIFGDGPDQTPARR